MDVILLSEMENLGKAGDMVKVANGYARNYLIPRGFAIEATTRSVKQLEHQKRIAEVRAKKERAEALSQAEKLEALKVTIAAKVGEEEKLYGSITRRNIAEAVAAEGIAIERKHILLEEPIRSTGVFDVDVKIKGDVTAKLRVWVVSEG